MVPLLGRVVLGPAQSAWAWPDCAPSCCMATCFRSQLLLSRIMFHAPAAPRQARP